MNKRLPLPVLDPARIEFGFERTCCACPACTVNCSHIPGYLIPADLPRIAAQHQPNTDVRTWARTFLLASPGALVLQRGRLVRIPTLVPARREDGACAFLTPDNACSIHALAPYGCAFFDAHMPKAQADQRSTRGLVEIIRAWQSNALYATIWQILNDGGRSAPGPEVLRSRMRD
jgi:Fe-S-cluster containining protein